VKNKENTELLRDVSYCPKCGGRVMVDQEAQELICEKCGKNYGKNVMGYK